MIPILLEVLLEALALQFLAYVVVCCTNILSKAFREDPGLGFLAWEAFWHLFVPRFVLGRIRPPAAVV